MYVSRNNIDSFLSGVENQTFKSGNGSNVMASPCDIHNNVVTRISSFSDDMGSEESSFFGHGSMGKSVQHGSRISC
jgi:hypothetical protein